MPYFEHKRIQSGSSAPAFPPKDPIGDDVTQVRTTSTLTTSNAKGGKTKEAPSKRRAFYTNALRRQEVVFGPEVCPSCPSSVGAPLTILLHCRTC